MCGVPRIDINRSSHKTKQSLITFIWEVFSNIFREAVERVCCWFWLRPKEAVGAKDDLAREM